MRSRPSCVPRSTVYTYPRVDGKAVARRRCFAFHCPRPTVCKILLFYYILVDVAVARLTVGLRGPKYYIIEYVQCTRGRL